MHNQSIGSSCSYQLFRRFPFVFSTHRLRHYSGVHHTWFCLYKTQNTTFAKECRDFKPHIVWSKTGIRSFVFGLFCRFASSVYRTVATIVTYFWEWKDASTEFNQYLFNGFLSCFALPSPLTGIQAPVQTYKDSV